MEKSTPALGRNHPEDLRLDRNANPAIAEPNSHAAVGTGTTDASARVKGELPWRRNLHWILCISGRKRETQSHYSAGKLPGTITLSSNKWQLEIRNARLNIGMR